MTVAGSGGLTLDAALRMATATLAAGDALGLQPLCVVVLDAGGRELVLLRSEQAAHYRAVLARAKAAGCIGMGMGGRAITARARAAPAFYAALPAIVPDGMVPVPGGVLVKDSMGLLIGAVGVSGDTADNDEAAALAGIAEAGLVADTGAVA